MESYTTAYRIFESSNDIFFSSLHRKNSSLGRDIYREKYFGVAVLFGLDEEEYDFSEVVWIPKNDPWIQGNVAEDFDEFVKSEEIQFIRYLNKGINENVYCANKFIVLDNTHLAYSFIGGYYLLEPSRL